MLLNIFFDVPQVIFVNYSINIIYFTKSIVDLGCSIWSEVGEAVVNVKVLFVVAKDFFKQRQISLFLLIRL